MKRKRWSIFAAGLVLTLLSGLFLACNGSETKSPSESGQAAPAETEDGKPADISGKFSVGYGRVSILPDYEVPLGGFGDTKTRISKGAYDVIYETCIAMTDETGETVLLFAVDIGNLIGNMGERIRKVFRRDS